MCGRGRKKNRFFYDFFTGKFPIIQIMRKVHDRQVYVVMKKSCFQLIGTAFKQFYFNARIFFMEFRINLRKKAGSAPKSNPKAKTTTNIIFNIMKLFQQFFIHFLKL